MENKENNMENKENNMENNGKGCTLTADDLDEIMRILSDLKTDAEAEENAAARKIVLHADLPGSYEFINAVRDNRIAKARRAHLHDLYCHVQAERLTLY